MRKFSSFITSLILILFPAVTYANDSAGTTSAGGITFSKIPDVVLEREELTISPSKVTVAYVFENKSKQDIQTQVLFPLPPYKMQGANATWDNEIDPGINNNSAPFVNFSVSVQGQPVQFGTATRAMLNDQDITQKLQAANIPLNPEFTAGHVPVPRSDKGGDKVSQWQTQAKQLGFLDDNNKPKWQKQVIYYWTQTFPAQQQLLVEHQYRPATGMMYGAMSPNSSPEELMNETVGRIKQTFGINIENLQDAKSLKGWLSNQIKNNANNTTGIFAYFYNVNYILKTGANWGGPIKNFTLNIMKPTDSMVTYNKFYPKGNAQVIDQADRRIIFIRNFIPQQDLQILYATANQLNP